MKKLTWTCAALAACAVFAEPSGDRPDARHAWAVHDVNRPDPVKITVLQNGIPSDAIVLFDGTAESVRKNWRSRAGEASKWTVKDGTFVCAPGSGPAVTAEKFADCQLHIEWKTPVDDVEGWGNSGVIFMGQYEIQILDSSAIEPSKSPWKPANYADGQAGAVYGQNPPLVNPCRKPGEWQSYDIVFHPPVREGQRLVDPGSITVFFNGVLVQDDFPFQGTTTWCRRLKTHAEAHEAPLYLQDHGHPVPFRNVWIRRIPSRYADTVNGSLGTKYGDVAKLRHELAAQSLAFADATDDPAEKFIRLWESYCYEPDRKVKHLIDDGEDATVKALANGQGSFGDPRRFNAFRRFVKMLVDSGWLAKDAKIAVQLGKMPAPPKPKAPNMRDF
ncbi:MAG: DUF1080 domain-containing protein [bacterium]|nr:DUF1080 domain-containing protein [bacterium]